MAVAAMTIDCVPLAPYWVTPSENATSRRMYSARSIGLMSVPQVTRPSMSLFRRPASLMASREASVRSECVVLPGYVRRVGISPMPTIAAAPRKLMTLASSSCANRNQLPARMITLWQ